LKNALGHQKLGGVFSDMAPNFSGQPLIEQAKMLFLTELLITFTQSHLKPKGFVVQKLFHGGEFQHIVSLWEKIFSDVTIYKPKSSRTESSEVYLVGYGLLAS
jgi:23S rRNA (uridine2552-2'-O)-methyltransferase